MKNKVVFPKIKIKQQNQSKNKILIGVLVSCLVISIPLVSFVIIPNYFKEEELREKEPEEKIEQKEEQEEKPSIEEKEPEKEETEQPEQKEETPKKEENPPKPQPEIKLKKDTKASFYSKKKVSDYIEYLNGTIVDDYCIDTTSLGEKEVSFKYINKKGITVPYSYKIKVVDDVPPQIWVNSTKSITTKYNGNLLEDITCADNIDDNPKCEIIGNYNTKVVGNYDLVYKAVDHSGNTTTKKFTLKVKEPSTGGSSGSGNKTKTLFSDVIKEHKTPHTKIGIDVSSWQGDIDYEAVKKAGVEFVFIRVGSTRGINGEYFVDKKFKRNIEGFNKVGIPVGIYFYSYANSKESAIRDAKWVIDQLEGYKVDLPVAYDWESWSFYNEFNQSFYSLSKNAKAYLDTLKAAGYEGMLYSSKSYLERVWFDTGYDIWLAHYTKQTSYKGKYKYWQLCSNGKVDGISGNVDINIYYDNK